MERPSNIKLGNDTFVYNELNVYQQTIYDEVLRQYERIQAQKTDDDKQKVLGVMEYLVSKMKVYGGLTTISLHQDAK